MARPVIGAPPGHHRQVGLGSGFLVESQRHLGPHEEAGGQNRPQRVIGGAHRGGVRTALGLGDDELAAEELHRIATKHAEIDEPLVLRAAPPAHGQRGLTHDATLPKRRLAVNVHRRRRYPLTDPAVSPCTMYFWKISTSRTAGSAPRKPEAAITE